MRQLYFQLLKKSISMIKVKEVRSFSEKLGVPALTIDKDWVLGHFLSGLFDNDYFQENLVFKGGTCLKKCYFENYRFSEDLDFTAIRIKRSKILSNLKKVIQKVESETGILFGKVEIKNQSFVDQLVAYACRIQFYGADHPDSKKIPPQSRWQTSIKLDFTLHETICLNKEDRKIIHPYSDVLPCYYAVCYPIEEILAEKFRALLQRKYAAPRDYYDLWYIITNHTTEIQWDKVASVFKEKCQYKNIICNTPEDFFDKNRMNNSEKEWSNSLKHHLSKVPLFDTVITDLKQQVYKHKRLWDY